MDNREVLVKIHFTTKYGVQLNSTRLIKNYNLYKHLVLKNIPDQVYIDYSNEDCELVDIKTVLDNANVITDKKQLESFNDLKNLLYKDVNYQYDLFTLIDNAYNDLIGCKVEKDLSFERYTYFNKKFIDISKSLMSKYMQFIGTDKFPKDVNQILLLELGDEKYNTLVNWLYEPITNDNNISQLLNELFDYFSTKSQNNSNTGINSSVSNIPLHDNAVNRFDTGVKQEIQTKEKVIITKNENGMYVFKDLVFNLKTSTVTGKWNKQTLSIDKLSKEDIELCNYFKLKYDVNNLQSTTEVRNISNNTSNMLYSEESLNKIKETKNLNQNKSNSNTSSNTPNSSNTPSNSPSVVPVSMSTINLKELLTKHSMNISLDQSNNEDEKVTENTSENTNENTSENLDSESVNGVETENIEQELINVTSVPNTVSNVSNVRNEKIIPLVNTKVSRGRKKTTNVTVGTSNLKQRL